MRKYEHRVREMELRHWAKLNLNPWNRAEYMGYWRKTTDYQLKILNIRLIMLKETIIRLMRADFMRLKFAVRKIMNKVSCW